MEVISYIEAIQVCYATGQRIIDIIKSWRHAHEEVRSRVVIVETTWNRSKWQVTVVQNLSHIIEDDLLRNLDVLLEELGMLLSAALTKLECLTKKEGGRWERLKASRAAYVAKKDALDKIIRDMEDWHRRYDSFWFLIMTITNPMIDAELMKGKQAAGAIENPGHGLPNAARNPLTAASNLRNVLTIAGRQSIGVSLRERRMEMTDIRFSDAKFGHLDGKRYIVDIIKCQGEHSVNKDDVRDLGAKLSQADPFNFGLLNCKGVMPVACRRSGGGTADQHSELRIVFRIPEGMETFQSLRALLLTADTQMSLTRKIRIASELAKSISYVHTFNFVHKNVRPESILCSVDPRGYTFLLGFDAFRAADGSTMMVGDTGWDRNLYRHPDRQGAHATEKYRMEHDIYSLGICLLEIGSSESFVDYQTHDVPQAVPGKLYSRFEEWLKSTVRSDQVSNPQGKPWQMKKYLVELAKTSLPSRMGEKYTSVVLACLTCLDRNDRFASSSTDDAGEDETMAVAVQFVEQTVLMLSEIAV